MVIRNEQIKFSGGKFYCESCLKDSGLKEEKMPEEKKERKSKRSHKKTF